MGSNELMRNDRNSYVSFAIAYDISKEKEDAMDVFSMERFTNCFPKILEKFPITLLIVSVSILFGVIMGLGMAIVRIKKVFLLNTFVQILISYVRGTPVIVQLFVVYYGVPVLVAAILHIDINSWDKIVFVFITYSINQAGFIAEHLRAAIQAVDAGQTEAGYSVGLTEQQTFFRIVAPQAFIIALPGISTIVIGLFHGTALAYMVGVMDMMGKVKSISTITYHSLEGYVSATIIFVIVSILLEQVFKFLNSKLTNQRVMKA